MNNDYEIRFAKNLRRLRLASGLTQASLAATIGYSEKTVSKWERADGIPGIETLYELAAFFRVSLDTLFQTETCYLLGIDGGGTKTHLALAELPNGNSEPNILREAHTDCCNPIDIGIDEAKTVLRNAIYSIADGIPMNNIVLFAGIAGSTSAAMKPEFSRFFSEFGFAAYENDTDNRNILAGGLRDRDGITLILGTGICAFAKIGDARYRVAGWGYLFDDGGSGYNLGRDALAAHFRALDGSGTASLLSDMIKEEHPDAQKLLGMLYEGGKKTIASFSRYVFDAAKENDETALAILHRNMRFAHDTIESAGRYFPMDAQHIPVILAGGITEQPLATDTLFSMLDSTRYAPCKLPTAPVMGALREAAALARKRSENQKR